MLKTIYRKILPRSIRARIAVFWDSRFNAKLLLQINEYFKRNIEEKKIYKSELEFIKTKNYIEIFPYEFTNKYDAKEILVAKDMKNDLFYVIHNNKKLYFQRGMQKVDVQNSYNALRIEQDNCSPHRYLTETFNTLTGCIVVDIGSAEGILSLDLIEKAREVYLFECEEHWIEALNATFAPWKEKVIIVKKYVSDKISEYETTVDAYFSESQMSLFIKIDVEGAESSVLAGAVEILKKDKTKIICCTYHKQNDAEEFKKLFNRFGYKTEFTDGYMIWKSDEDLKPPFFRKGLIRAWKEVI